MSNDFPHFNDFPEEVQRLVFEYAFEGFGPKPSPNASAPKLAIISKQVNSWIEPLLYRTISTSKFTANPVRKASRKPKDFFKNHVKSLVVDELNVPEFVEDIIFDCHENLIGLAWWSMTHDRQKWASLLLTLPFPSLRKLSLSYGIIPNDVENPFSRPIFQNLTHLDIGFPPSDAHFTPSSSSTNLQKITAWEGLRSLENLIHLHLDMERAVTFRAADVAGQFHRTILNVLPHLPQNVKYLSINLPHSFLSRAESHNNTASRQIFDDLINGKTDPRIVVWYTPTKWLTRARGSVVVGNPPLVKGFGSYLLLRRQHASRPSNKARRVSAPKPENDFWEEAERMICKRNKELFGREEPRREDRDRRI